MNIDLPKCEGCGEYVPEEYITDGLCPGCENEKILENPPDQSIIIEVEGGIVTDVSNLPDGWDYTIIDHDCY